MQTEKSQLEPCIKFCRDHNWELLDIYKEHGKSAYRNVCRPKYEAILSLVRKHRIQHIVVWALDRWTRRGNKELRSTIAYLDSYNVQLHSVREYWVEQITTPKLSFIKDIILDLLGWIGQQESERIGERVKASNKFQKAIANGTVGHPAISSSVKQEIKQLLKEGKTYVYISQHVTYKLKYGKIRHVSAPTISAVKKSMNEELNEKH